MMYKQCVLEKCRAKQTAWILEQFAHIGKFLKIKDDSGQKVTEVGAERFSEVYALERQEDYKNQAKASDKCTPNKGLGL